MHATSSMSAANVAFELQKPVQGTTHSPLLCDEGRYPSFFCLHSAAGSGRPSGVFIRSKNVRLENGCHHDVDRRLLSYAAILNSIRNKPCRAYWCTITGVRNCTLKCSTARHNLIALTRT
ncbi:hypothetical protein V5799_021189 [Amblyomma americanum]|uniref:Uncharacterized protein n=1 Tax=Amblyomma americanum TaxID=6943 RepID=A0AAQ4FPM8_AMBAM